MTSTEKEVPKAPETKEDAKATTKKDKPKKDKKPKADKPKDDKPKEDKPTKEKKPKEDKPKEDKPKEDKPKKEKKPKADKPKEDKPKEDKPKEDKPKKEKKPKEDKPKTEKPKEEKKAKKGEEEKKGEPKKEVEKKRLAYVIDCTLPVKDKVFQAKELLEHFLNKIKVDKKCKNLGKAVQATCDDGKKIRVNAEIPLAKRYLKYLAKKFLKKQEVRDYLRLVAPSRTTYEFKYFKMESGE